MSKPIEFVLFCAYFLVEEKKFGIKKKAQKLSGQTKMESKEIPGPRNFEYKIFGVK